MIRHVKVQQLVDDHVILKTGGQTRREVSNVNLPAVEHDAHFVVMGRSVTVRAFTSSFSAQAETRLLKFILDCPFVIT